MAIKRFLVRRPFNETNITKVPKGKPIVYKILDRKGKNIYTGSAKKGRVSQRLEDHLPGARDAFPGSKFFQIKQAKRIREAETQERRIIAQEKPKFNQIGK